MFALNRTSWHRCFPCFLEQSVLLFAFALFLPYSLPPHTPMPPPPPGIPHFTILRFPFPDFLLLSRHSFRQCSRCCCCSRAATERPAGDHTNITHTKYDPHKPTVTQTKHHSHKPTFTQTNIHTDPPLAQTMTHANNTPQLAGGCTDRPSNHVCHATPHHPPPATRHLQPVIYQAPVPVGVPLPARLRGAALPTPTARGASRCSARQEQQER